MHILMFCEQHPHTLGGAQMSTLLQAKFLRRAGHTVTLVSPALRSGPLADPDFIDLPSWPIPTVAEYTWLWPRQTHLTAIDDALTTRPPVDVVHVQSDFWGAAFGYRFAAQHDIPLVHTFHNRLDVGVDAAFPFPGLLYAILGLWQRWSLGGRFRGHSGTAYDYFAGYAREAAAITAPSRHFARVLAEHGVADRDGGSPTVIPTGVDDDVVAAVVKPAHPISGPNRIAWVGRFSPEKRPVEFCDALNLLHRDTIAVLVGDGALRDAAQKVAPWNAVFTGPLSYSDTLRTIAEANVLVQSSFGFETQGMTVTEALALGTAVVVVDPDIANELPAGQVTVAKDLSPQGLAVAIESAISETHGAPAASPTQRKAFLQSTLTVQAIALYQSAIAR
jgi:glycosyltransferase involved in cell wall biosynthesis